MLEGEDGSAVASGGPVDAHSLLLSLAGLIDDELLGWARELVAVGEPDYAFGIVIGAVIADQARLPGPVHDALSARWLQPGEELPASRSSPMMAHRFLADPAAAGYPASVIGGSPVDAVRALPARLVDDCKLWLSWRLTPAGSAPVPVPHPVLLIETADGSGTDVLAYQVADLLRQEGVFASVEVFGPGIPIGEYHRTALVASVTLHGADGADGADTPESLLSRPAPTPAEGAATGSGSAAPSSGAATPAAPTSAGAALNDEPGPARDAGKPPGGPPVAGPAAVLPPGREDPSQTFGPELGPSRPPLHPVDRVIAARATAPRNPVDNALPFDRGSQDRPMADRPPLQDRPVGEPWDQGRPPSRDQRPPPRDEQARPPLRPVRQPGPHPGSGQRPGSGPQQGPSQSPLSERRPMDRRKPPPRPPAATPATGHPPGQPPSSGQPGPPGQPPSSGQPGPPGQPPLSGQPGQLGQPPSSGQLGQPPSSGQPGQPPAQSLGRPAQRPPLRPTDSGELPDGLSEVEQRLLRQLHEELASREHDELADQQPQRSVRNGNGNGFGGRPPRPPTGPPPDRAH